LVQIILLSLGQGAIVLHVGKGERRGDGRCDQEKQEDECRAVSHLI
jgi:hypothetical protein